MSKPMFVTKRNGTTEPVKIEKITAAITRFANGLSVDPIQVAVKTIGSIHDGVTTCELDLASVATALSLSETHPDYAALAARLQADVIRKEVVRQDIHSFSEFIEVAFKLKLVTRKLHKFATSLENKKKLNNAIKEAQTDNFNYFALRDFAAHRLIHHPETKKLLEIPQFALMRFAISQSKDAAGAVAFYKKMVTPGFVIEKEGWHKYGTPDEPKKVLKVNKSDFFVRPLAPGMGQAVAERTVFRKNEAGEWETWGDVAHRVAYGNAILADTQNYPQQSEFLALRDAIAKGATLMSGRHLQHGDAQQPTRNMEVFTNCSTASTSFLLFYLLLNGSGVGRAYDDDMMVTNWDYAPNVRCVLDESHPDFNWESHESLRDARHKYVGPNVIWFDVPDSREGWAKALEMWETMTYEKCHANKTLVLNFTAVRKKGSPIGGMQERPASGPAPLMLAFSKALTLKGTGLAPWLQAMYIDHYFAECVLVGGARRAARMSTKYWRDKSVLEFITVKRPLEYLELTPDEILEFRKKYGDRMAFLWSSNNSIVVDDEFWRLVRKDSSPSSMSPAEKHAKKVFELAVNAAYCDGTGEPGFLNGDKLTRNDEGWEVFESGNYVESAKVKLNEDTQVMMGRIARIVKKKKHNMIVNPCVVKDSWTMTKEGPRQVRELINKPFTAVVDGVERQSPGFWLTGTKPVFRIETDRGYEIPGATDNHEILIERGRRQKLHGGYNIDTEWVEVKNLKVGDKIVLQNHGTHLSWGDQSPEEFDKGWLLGSMVGDGGYNPEKYSSYVRFWGESKTEMAGAALATVKQLPFDGHRPVQLGELRKESTNRSVEVGSVVLDNLAEGLIEPATKELLPNLERQGSLFLRGFISGFFDADGSPQGSLDKGLSVRLSQSSLAKLKVVQRILLRLGMASTIYEDRREAGEKLLPNGKGSYSLYPIKAQHELVISRDNIVRFYEQIGFREPGKQALLESFLLDRKRPVYQDTFTTEITAIIPDGVEDVYDTNIPEVHRFDCNGLTVHNCGEIALSLMGGFCVIADLVPFHCDTLDEVEATARLVTRALIRVNTMDSIYGKEVRRTNRIGIGLTGVHEFAWKFFGLGFDDLVDEEKSKDFWMFLARINRAVRDESIKYATELGVTIPHTCTTCKPSGTVSKLFGLTEGWHLPSMAYYLRNVQFTNDDPLVEQYKSMGYPTRKLVVYKGMTIVGFPTVPTITTLGMGDKLVCAGDASPKSQFRWLQLAEKYWIDGVEADGSPVKTKYGNQVSYTLKYKPEVTSLNALKEMVLAYQPTVKCCSIMPQEDESGYEYLPEQPISAEDFAEISSKITKSVDKASTITEEIGREHLDCAGGACPIDFRSGSK